MPPDQTAMSSTEQAWTALSKARHSRAGASAFKNQPCPLRDREPCAIPPDLRLRQPGVLCWREGPPQHGGATGELGERVATRRHSLNLKLRVWGGKSADLGGAQRSTKGQRSVMDATHSHTVHYRCALRTQIKRGNLGKEHSGATCYYFCNFSAGLKWLQNHLKQHLRGAFVETDVLILRLTCKCKYSRTSAWCTLKGN